MFAFVRLAKAAVVSRIMRPAGWRGRVTQAEYDQLVAQGVVATDRTARLPTPSRRAVSPQDPHRAAQVPPAAARTRPYFEQDDQRMARPHFDEDQPDQARPKEE